MKDEGSGGIGQGTATVSPSEISAEGNFEMNPNGILSPSPGLREDASTGRFEMNFCTANASNNLGRSVPAIPLPVAGGNCYPDGVACRSGQHAGDNLQGARGRNVIVAVPDELVTQDVCNHVERSDLAHGREAVKTSQGMLRHAQLVIANRGFQPFQNPRNYIRITFHGSTD
jgi:hypothetical protein